MHRAPVPTPPFDRDTPAFHPDYLRMLCGLLDEEGGDVGSVLHQSGLCAEDLRADGPMLSLPRARWLIVALERAAGRPTLALEAGARVRPSWHGPLGDALASSADLRQALALVSRYAVLRTRCFQAILHLEPSGARYAIEPGLSLADVRRFVLDHVLASTVALMRRIGGATAGELALELPWARPAWHRTYRLFADTLRFDAPGLTIRLPDALLDRPNPTADRERCAQACRECDTLLDAPAIAASVTPLVQQVLERIDLRSASLALAASALGTSSRTLVRRLNEEGVTFQQLLDELRCRRAVAMLRGGDHAVSAIAGALGYRSASNFGRSFRRWVGTTPTAFAAAAQP
jgi:AraC-like DNA-binding protein